MLVGRGVAEERPAGVGAAEEGPVADEDAAGFDAGEGHTLALLAPAYGLQAPMKACAELCRRPRVIALEVDC